MNDIENETVRFAAKPNPLFYALELVWHGLIWFTGYGGFLLVFSPVVLLTAYFLVGLAIFMLALVAARHLVFLVTDKKAIVRSSFGEEMTDVLSIAIETVKRIDITSCGATYGSVYLTYDETSPRENSKDGAPDHSQLRPIRRASIPIERPAFIWVSLSNWPRWLGFYGFKGFDEFANIISEQQSSVPNVKGDTGSPAFAGDDN